MAHTHSRGPWLGCLPNPGSDVGQLVRGRLPSELHVVDMDWVSWSRRFIPPDEVDQVLTGVDEPRALWMEEVVEFGGFGATKHAGVDTDTRVLGIFDEPFNPVFRAISASGLDKVPI